MFTNLRKIMILLALVVLLGVVVGGAWAQEPDSTPDAQAAFIEAVSGGTVESVTDTDSGQVVVIDSQTEATSNELLLLLMPVLSALFGVLAGGGGVFYILSRANENKPLKDSTERLLYESTPPQTIDILHQLAVGVRQGAQFLEAVTDGKINE